MFELRPAVESDFPQIKALIREVRINPLGLDWRRFVLAMDEYGNMAGCGQLKPHRDGSLELASIAVVAQQRGRGVARLVIDHLIERSRPQPLYLTCRSNLGPFYERFGFRTLALEEMPPYFRQIYRLVRAFRLAGNGLTMLVMRREPEPA